VLWSFGAYGAAGISFALWFVLHGVGRIDASAKSAPWGFRLLILPGVAALWPAMVFKTLHAQAAGGRPG
jgi:hypothetical protein